MAEQQIQLRIQGMTCPSCAHHVTNALESVPRVVEAEVPGSQSGQAVVFADLEVPQAQLVDAVNKAGYSAAIEEVELTSAAPPIPEDTNVDFDLLVIGGGSGGIAASEAGKRVGLINAGTIGGTCVNIGCIPSKTLIRAAEAWYKAGHPSFHGVNTAQVELDWPTLRAEKDTLVARLRQSKYVDVLAAYPAIQFIEGDATFQPNGSVRVGDRSYRASRYVIATGAKPHMIPFPGTEEVQPLNSTSLMELDKLPKSLIILGGRVGSAPLRICCVVGNLTSQPYRRLHMGHRTRWIIVIGVGVLLIALAAWQGSQRAAGLEQVTDISSIDQLQAAFNSDVGVPRLVLILSPT